MATPMTKKPASYIRRFPRRAVDLRLSLMDEHGKRYRGRCSSLSEGGFGAVLAGELPLGTMMTVEFSSRETGKEVRLMARLRYRNGFHHGFEFTAPTDRQRRVIAEFFHDNVDLAG